MSFARLWRIAACLWLLAAPAHAQYEDTAETIHRLALEGAPIELSAHAKKRMKQRGMTLEEIREVLSEGVIRQPPRMGSKGDMTYKLEDEDTTGDKDGEVVVIVKEKSLFIVTVMWDD